MTSTGLGLSTNAIVRRYTIKPSHFIRRTNRNQKGKSRWNSKGISQRNQQWTWKTQNESEMAVKDIIIEIKMIITVYMSEGNVNSMGSRCTIFGCIGTALRPFIWIRSIRKNQRRTCQGFEVWMESGGTSQRLLNSHSPLSALCDLMMENDICMCWWWTA